jgi:hypothetical protein
LRIDIGDDRQATLHTPVAFDASVSGPGSADDTHAKVVWAFGNGGSAEGYSAEATYDEPGTYLVAAKATDGATAAHAMVTVTVTNAAVRIASLTSEGVAIANDGSAALDLSGWVLVEGVHNFRIPEGTWIAPGASALFTAAATKLAASDTAILAYPDGSVAAAYPVGTPGPQPVALIAGYNKVQTVEPALISPNATDHATAPPAGDDTGGAALDASISPPGLDTAAAGMLHSRWTLGALAAVVVAGGAILIL